MNRPTVLDMDLVVVPREATDEMQFAGNANVYGAMLSASPYPTAWDDVRKYVEGLEALASKVNGIRNSIIGCQKMNWSEHIYPLVAALEEAGIEGAGYPKAREYVGTMLERTLAAEESAAAAEACIAELEKRLADAERVIEPFAAVAEFDIGDDEYDDDVFRPITAKNARVQLINVGHLRAARAYREGK